tara:strand:+ start:2188 stop:2412 length:225 start_codon:yes stop_codon:yes gene_type:complete
MSKIKISVQLGLTIDTEDLSGPFVVHYRVNDKSPNSVMRAVGDLLNGTLQTAGCGDTSFLIINREANNVRETKT